MKSTVEKVSSLGRRLHIEVAATDVDSAYDKALKSVQKDVEVKGFRKGKAPLSTIRTMYGDRIKNDIIQDLVQIHYPMALREHDLTPINYPEIEFDSLDEGTDFKFSANFEIRPNVEIKNFEKLQVNKEKLGDLNKRVDQSLDNIRRNRAELVTVFEDRAAVTGDVVEISFNGTIGGMPLEGGSSEHSVLELGSQQMIPGFESGIEGMKPGETRTISIEFPTNYHVDHLAGKPVTFEIKVKALKTKRLPELNDEFAKALGPFENLEALRKTVRESLEEEESKRIEGDLRTAIIEALAAKNPVELPASLVADQKQMLTQDLQKRLGDQHHSEEEIKEYVIKWDPDLEKSAQFMVHSSFLIDKLASDFNLHWTEEDFEKRLSDMAATSGIELKKIKEFYTQPKTKSRLVYRITEDKVIDFLLSKAVVTETEARESTSDD